MTSTVAHWPFATMQTVVTVVSLLLALQAASLLAALAVVSWVGGTGPAQPVVFISYLLVVIVAPLGTWFWAAGEKSRWGAGVVCVAALVLPVLLVRLDQVWSSSVV